jgi:hypothetical protein
LNGLSARAVVWCPKMLVSERFRLAEYHLLIAGLSVMGVATAFPPGGQSRNSRSVVPGPQGRSNRFRVPLGLAVSG